MGKDLAGKELGTGIVQRKNGHYEARYVNRFGKRVSITSKNLREVKKKLSQAQYENSKELNLRESMTLDEWFLKWMDIYKIDIIRANTRTKYKSYYRKHISPSIGHYKLQEIKQIDIKELLKNMSQNGYGYEVKNAVRIMCVDLFSKAIYNEYLNKNPAKGISVKRDENKDIRVLSIEEQTLFFDCCKGTFYDNFFITAVSTGMRIGELAALRWNDIDLTKKVIHVNRTLVYQKYDTDTKKEFHLELPKTKTSKRDIPINKQCEAALKKQFVQKSVVTVKAPVSKKPAKEFRDLLFTTTCNTPLNSQIICDAIDKIVTEINLTRDILDEIETFSAHCLRHTFATRCFEAGIQPRTVQAYLGHATLQMTMDLYTSVMPEYSFSEMDKISDLLDSISTNGENLIEEQYGKLAANDKIIPIKAAT